MEIGRTAPLHEAILNRNVREAKQLIYHYSVDINKYGVVKNGANIPGCEGLVTPLHLSLYLIEHRFTRMLMENHANVHMYTHDGFAPIHIAVMRGFVQNLRYVLLKSDINFPAKHKSYQGWTALHLAIFLDEVEMAKLLIENGADIASKADNGITPLQLIKKPYTMQAIFSHLRFMHRTAEVFEYLAIKGVNFNETIYPAQKSLFLIAHEFGFHEAIEAMRDQGAKDENENSDWLYDTLHFSISAMSL